MLSSMFQTGNGPVLNLLRQASEATGISPPDYLTQWIPGTTPLSTWKDVCFAVTAYLAIIFGGQEWMRNRPAYKLKIPFQIHNIFLTLGSGLLLVLILEEIIPRTLANGTYWSICSTKAFNATLVSYYIVNYYFKYVELIDTVFLVAKKKPLQFLHVFHHAATAILCFTQLEGETAVQWVVISLNLWVHVIMYYYYYATAGGAKIWWKKYLTTMQITQFVIDLFIVYFATTQHFFFAYSINLPWVRDCTGAETAALLGCGLLTSYLLLFIAFYKKTYKAGAARKAAAAKKAQ